MSPRADMANWANCVRVFIDAYKETRIYDASWPDNAGTDDLGSVPAPLQADVLLGNRDSAGWPVRDAAAAEEDE